MIAQQLKFDINVSSEIGTLEGVILHTPGLEIENMTPENAERALYSDILNLSVGSLEYMQHRAVLEKVTTTFQVSELLEQVLLNTKVRQTLIEKIVFNENAHDIREDLMALNERDLARCLIEGMIMKKDNLSKFLNKERYSLRPLHNFFFTRDASITVNDWILISKMANKVRSRESLIMESIFDFHPMFSAKTVNPLTLSENAARIKIEGGDVLIAREDVLLVGIGARTTPEAVDFLIEHYKMMGKQQHIIVQELPTSPESFIHLDMVFTFLDINHCMVYEPVILQPNRFRTVHIEIDNGDVVSINEYKHLLKALKKVGLDLKPINCGGNSDPWIQEREQWHSGANFFAVGPGKIIGYRRNVNTIEELDKNGFTIIDAAEVCEGKIDLSSYDKYVVTIDGSELARGGGGCRCMTMPIKRAAINF
jgi:arginine deiminase